MVCGRALALQFHPEATESIVRLWMNEEGTAELDAVGLDRDQMMTETRAQLDGAERRCDDLVEWFLSSVAQSHKT
jgi:hypothetical protein